MHLQKLLKSLDRSLESSWQSNNNIPESLKEYINGYKILGNQRNSNGEVISAIQTNALRYLEHPMLDKYLDIVPNVKTGTVNGKIVELKQMDWTTEFPDCFEKVTCQNYMHSFVTILGMSYQGESYEVFRGLNHAHVVQMGDSVTSYWSVYRTLD